jgi:hypothetical protein
VDVVEVKKLDAYLSKLFGNPNIRVVPKKGDVAEVFIGEDDLGELTVDDEDGDRSFNFRMVIQVSSDPSFQPLPALTAYLRGKFDNENIRVVMRPKKTDSVEAYIGDEFLGVLFAENEKGRRSYIFELPILDVDRAKTVIVLKRGMAAGFAGIENELFYGPSTSMLFGDAKSVLTQLAADIKSL